MVVNWPEVVVDSVARRLNVEGFRLGQGGEADDELWRIWTANQMDEESPLAHVDALVHGVAYLLVWGNDFDPRDADDHARVGAPDDGRLRPRRPAGPVRAQAVDRRRDALRHAVPAGPGHALRR